MLRSSCLHISKRGDFPHDLFDSRELKMLIDSKKPNTALWIVLGTKFRK